MKDEKWKMENVVVMHNLRLSGERAAAALDCRAQGRNGNDQG
jgi:hypothetical protein